MEEHIKISNFKVYNASAGSGKTFTLVKEYLKIVLGANNIFKYQQILAITFTNKAASEMKERIITNLREFSNPSILKNPTHLFEIICDELDHLPEEIHQKSKKIIKNILNNYASFNITTIDSFTYKLIRSFAFDLGLSLNFDVEMDVQSLVNEAVDVLISRIGMDEKLTKTLVNYSLQKANDDTSWDIALDLKTSAKLLLNEDDLQHVAKIQNKSLDDFVTLKSKLYKDIHTIENNFRALGEKGLELIYETALHKNDFSHSGELYNHFVKLKQKNLKGLLFENRLNTNIEADYHFCAAKASVGAKDEIAALKPKLIALYYESKKYYNAHYKEYLLDTLVLKSLIPLAVLRSISDVLEEIKEDNNIRLNSEFNTMISDHLKEQPVAFIYEKIGEKFKHYFIDEMQDTSIMQWENLIPLISNALESENEKGDKGSLMLVGDAKQAIYRWRGGKAEQFISLSDVNEKSPFLVEKQVEQLETNFRSFSEIIDFNNSFFQFISKHLKKDTYRELYDLGNKQLQNTKKGGFVQISFIDDGYVAAEKEHIYPEKALEIITKIKGDFKLNEICILTRSKKHGVAMANYLTEQGVPIISSETLLLQNSPKVQCIIHVLHILQQPKDEERKLELLHYLHQKLNLNVELHSFLQTHVFLDNTAFFNALKELNIYFESVEFDSLSLYDSIEYIIRSFQLTTTSCAYIQFFLDVILDFSYKKSEGIDSFLNYWDDKKEKLSITVPDGKDAVRIMTIHKSKGLEFPVIIYPFDMDIYKQIDPKVWYSSLNAEKFNNFSTTLVAYGSTLKESGIEGEILYNQRQEELELDNFNLLYVALTRAVEQLYILSEHKSQKKEPRWYSHFFKNYLEEKGDLIDGQSVYSYGDSKRIPENNQQTETLTSLTQPDFISTHWRDTLTIVVNNSIEDDTEDARVYGNLMHSILANIITYNDVDKTIDAFVNKGLVNLENKETLKITINNVVTHTKLKHYFSNKVIVENEREIITDEVSEIIDKKGDIIGTKKNIIIPDRLVFEDNNVTIIDYKTGKPDKKYNAQLNKYARFLTKMNFNVIEKLLVYIDDEVHVVSIG